MSREEAFKASLVTKVAVPTPEEAALIEDRMLLSFVWPAQNRHLSEVLVGRFGGSGKGRGAWRVCAPLLDWKGGGGAACMCAAIDLSGTAPLVCVRCEHPACAVPFACAFAVGSGWGEGGVGVRSGWVGVFMLSGLWR